MLKNKARQYIEKALQLKILEIYPELVPGDVVVEDALFKDKADFQSSIALKCAKTLRKNPIEIAKTISESISSDENVSSFVTRPGFINFRVNDSYLKECLISGVYNHASTEKRAVVDYSGPNAAKQMHVGHLRSTVIGDAIANLYEFCGWEVQRVNHLGDWGTQFGMIIQEVFDHNISLDNISIEDLENIYRRSKIRFDSDDDFRRRALSRVAKLQSGDCDTHRAWSKIRAISIAEFEKVYKKLGVKLGPSHVMGESYYSELVSGVVDSLEHSGLVFSDDSSPMLVAKIDYPDRDHPLPFVVRKSDGSYLYSSTDLAAAKYRIEDLKSDRIIYVTDARQSDHFKCLFSLCKSAGWGNDSISLIHCAFGMVTDENGKPLKTRESDNVKLSDLIDEGIRKVRSIYSDRDHGLDDEVLESTVENIAVACVKYADLSTDRVNNYSFDWNKFISYDGNTAIYLYSGYTKSNSLITRFYSEDLTQNYEFSEFGAIERSIVIKMEQFSEAIDLAFSELRPSILCSYVYQLTKLIHSYYEAERLSEIVDSNSLNTKLLIYRKYIRIFEISAEILGLPIISRM